MNRKISVKLFPDSDLLHFICIKPTFHTACLVGVVDYYNSQRPHEGIEQKIPEGYLPKKSGKVVSIPVLFGLHHHCAIRFLETGRLPAMG